MANEFIARNGIIAKNNSTVTGSLDVTGSLGVTGSFSTQTYDGTNYVPAISIGNFSRAIYDVMGTSSFDADSRTLFDDMGIFAANWIGRTLYDATGTANSLSWGSRLLYDAISATSIDWNNRVLIDSFGTPALEWTSRQLFDSAGNAAISWNYLSQIQAVEINSYTRKTLALSTIVEPFSDFPTYGTFNPDGELLKGVALDGTVADFDLVYLETDNKWYPATQGTADCSKLLGIAWNVGTGKETVLIEGTMVVNDGTYFDTPVVQSINFGLPIYIRQSAGNSMSTVVPTTAGQYVRILGHAYHQNGNNTEYWVMKFRPANDWYVI
jgi:hypothetical protein